MDRQNVEHIRHRAFQRIAFCAVMLTATCSQAAVEGADERWGNRNAPARLNQAGHNDYIWSGVTPDLRISGPGLEAQPIPEGWLNHE
jgi:hypothetical protein